MPGVFNLAKIFELIVDRFDDGAFFKKQFVQHGHELVGHVAFEPGDQLQASLKQRLEKFAGNVAPVSEELAEDVLGQGLHHRKVSVVDVAGSQHDGDEIAPMVDNEMQFEAVEPSHGCLAACGDSAEGFMAMDAAVVTDLEGRGINKSYSVGLLEPTAFQKCRERHDGSAHKLDEAVVTYKTRKLRTQMWADVFDIKVFEGSVS